MRESSKREGVKEGDAEYRKPGKVRNRVDEEVDAI
jgi:hypothetical protein